MKENEKLALVAGILEGEGAFSIAKCHDKRKGSDYFTLKAGIVIVNSELKLLEFCQSVLGGRIYKKNEPKGSYPFHRKVFDLRIVKLADIHEALGKLSPFFITKNRQAQLLKEFCDSRLNNRSNKGYSQREMEIYRVLGGMHNKGRASGRSYAK